MKEFGHRCASIRAAVLAVIVALNTTVTVFALDTSRPSVDLYIAGIENPHNFAVSGASASLTASASDDTGVTKVEFYIDNILYSIDDSAPYAATWNLGADDMVNGPHIISVLAYDAVGNMGFDEFNEAIVNNHASTYSCSGATLLICQDFQTAAGSSNFVTNGGTWSMGGALYALSNPAGSSGGNANLAIHNVSAPGDFTLKMQATSLEGQDPDFSVVWGYQNTSNYYFANFSKINTSMSNGIFKVSGGIATQLADFATTIESSKRYKVKVEKTGSAYRVYRNDISVGAVDDSVFSSGKVGLGTRDSTASFYYTTVEAGTPAPYVAPLADTTPPVVAIVEPSVLASVTGNVRIRWAHLDDGRGANDAMPIADREVLADGVPLALSPTNFTNWQTTSFMNGQRTITVNAYDAAGNLGTRSINVMVANETVAPVVTVTSPANGATVVGDVNISSSASDNAAISRVEFYVGDVLKASDPAAPYEYIWDSKTMGDGLHSIEARAFDTAGNMGTNTVSVTVANTQLPVPVYRLTNYYSQERLFTTSALERDIAVANYPGWVYEGVAFSAYSMQAALTVPVYRLTNYYTQERLFTTSMIERDVAVAHYPGWVYEGIAFYAYATNNSTGSPVYRLANYYSQERLFTTSVFERDYAVAHYPGWVYEGEAFKVP